MAKKITKVETNGGLDVADARRRHALPPEGDHVVSIVPGSYQPFPASWTTRGFNITIEVAGDGRRHTLRFLCDGGAELGAFIERDLSLLESWAEQSGVPFTGSPAELVREIAVKGQGRETVLTLAHRKRPPGLLELVALGVQVQP